MTYSDKLLQSINETNQESNYLQFCRSETDCNFRIHCLLEAVCYLTFSSTRPPPVTVYPLQVKFELLLQLFLLGQHAQYLCKQFPCCFIGHKVACLFYWPQSGLFVLLATKWPVCFFGHNVACLFYWPQSGLFVLLATKWPMHLHYHYVITSNSPYFYCFRLCNACAII